MNVPRVGIGVMVVKDKKVLIGKRKNAHGTGTWAFPGGHLEFGESFETCAAREVFEETGITVKNIQFFACTNDIFPQENKHYITVWMRADYTDGIVETKEPHKCEGWHWFYPEQLPSPLFISMSNLLKQQKLPIE